MLSCATCRAPVPIDEFPVLIDTDEGAEFRCAACAEPGPTPKVLLFPVRPLCPVCKRNALPELRTPARDRNGRPQCDDCEEREGRAAEIVAGVKRRTLDEIAPAIARHRALVAMKREDPSPEEAVRAFVSRYARIVPAPQSPRLERPRRGPEPFDPEKVKHVRLPYGDDKD